MPGVYSFAGPCEATSSVLRQGYIRFKLHSALWVDNLSSHTFLKSHSQVRYSRFSLVSPRVCGSSAIPAAFTSPAVSPCFHRFDEVNALLAPAQTCRPGSGRHRATPVVIVRIHIRTEESLLHFPSSHPQQRQPSVQI